MQKKIIALAIAAAFAAPLAMADTANVVVYGALNMSMDKVDGGDGDGSYSRNRVSSNNSYFGLKGVEDLGGDLSAVWQFEQAYSMDNGGFGNIDNNGSNGTASSSGVNNTVGNNPTAGQIGQRNTFMGLSSKTLGTLTLGNQESPMKTSIGSLDQFGNTLGDYRTLMGPQVRGASSVLYASPVFSGFSGKFMYSARNEDGTDGASATADRTYKSGSLTYANGPIFAAIAHESASITTTQSQTTTRLGVGYTFGDAKVGLGYNTTKQDLNATEYDKTTSVMLSGSYNLSKALTLKAQHVKVGDIKTEFGAFENTGAKHTTIGVDYALSKRTNLYALYTVLNNDSDSDRNIGNNAIGGTNIRSGLGGVRGANTGLATVIAGDLGSDPTALSFGMIHKF